MCLAVPGRVVEIDGKRAMIDYGGTKRSANISMVDAKVGDYVVVHAGFAIEIMDEESAKDVIHEFEEMMDKLEL